MNLPFTLRATRILFAASLCVHCSSGPPPTDPDPIPRAHASTEPSARPDHTLEVVALRDAIDAAGRQAECDAILADAPSGLSSGEADMLAAWCGWRAGNPSGALGHAASAARYFEATLSWRRAIESNLLATLAAEAMDDPAMAHWRERAESILLTTREPLTGDARDPFSGDLPYLAARSSHAGLSIALRRLPISDGSIDRLPTDSLYKLAAREYDAFDRAHARAHSTRDRASLARDRGDLPNAARALSALVERHARLSDPRPLHEDLHHVALLAQASGDASRADAIQEWLFEQASTRFLDRHRTWANFPGATRDLSRHVRAGDSRSDLVNRIRTARRDPDLAIAPPTDMLRSLAELEDLSEFDGDAWRLALEAGLLFAERGRHVESRRYLRHAVASLESMRARLGSLDARTRLTRTGRDAYLALVRDIVAVDTANLTQSDYADALSLASALKARGLSELLAGFPLPHTNQTALAIDADASRTDVVRDALGALAALSRTPERGFAAAPFEMPSLPKDTIALEYLVDERSGYVWVLHDGHLSMRRIAGMRTLGPLLERFRSTLVDPSMTPDEISEHRALAERLHVELLGPIEDLLVHADDLVVSPDGPLHHLPFEALARPSKTSKTPEYLVSRHAISYVPSLAVLAQLQSRPARSSAREALVVGDPILDQPGVSLLPFSRDLPDSGLFRVGELFPELPGVARELTGVARALSKRASRTTVLRGEDANEAALRTRDLTAFKFVHIATHGLSDASAWRRNTQDLTLSQPALLLGREPEQPDDGILSLTELLSFSTAADLVVLSGCTTGRGWSLLGDAAYGLAGAFLYTGSRAVVASTWSVADAATGELMRKMYAHIGASTSPARALRLAQLELMRDGSPFSPPFYWAGFRVVGVAE